MDSERFELVSTLYVLCADYHSGQWSRGYRILSRITTRYNPRLSDSHWKEIRESELYTTLAERYGDKL